VTGKNAQVIIPLALAAWLGSLVALRPGVPVAAQAAFIGAFVVAVPTAVFYLMSEMGWSTLAKRFRARERFDGGWTGCPTGQMALVSVHDPEFARNKLRLVGGTLRLATTATALHMSMLLSKVPLLGRFFPEVEIPWSSITSAATFEAPGWFTPSHEPGTIGQAAYDPSYTGTFVELVAGEPPVFIQLPAALLGDAQARLPRPANSQPRSSDGQNSGSSSSNSVS
jgi:hypothetical protein